jgi:nucleotide-binding universal stress UspA family protein
MTMTDARAGRETWQPVHGPRVVVGIDGSETAGHALQAATRAARAMGVPLVAFTVWSAPGLEDRGIEDALTESAWRTQDDAVRQAFGEADPRFLHRTVCEGSPARVLLQESQGASLLVVGSLGTGGFAGLQLGSVGVACAARAPCPVLVIKRPPRLDSETRRPRISVGVDGSQSSLAALTAAERAAEQLQGELEVVTVCSSVPGVADDHEDELLAAARTRQAAALEEVLGGRRGGEAGSVVRTGSPAGVLVALSSSADLLVIGSRAQGAVSGVLFGGVTMACAQHAVCDVLIVHTPDVPEAAPRPGLEHRR